MPLLGIPGRLFGSVRSFPTCGSPDPGPIPARLYSRMCFARHGFNFAPSFYWKVLLWGSLPRPTRNSAEPKDMLHAEPELPQGDWTCEAGFR